MYRWYTVKVFLQMGAYKIEESEEFIKAIAQIDLMGVSIEHTIVFIK